MKNAGRRTESAGSEQVEDDDTPIGAFGVAFFFARRCGPVHIER